MAKKNDPFTALMTIAQDQQGYFTTKQAIEAGYADNTHPYHVRAGNWERVWRGIYRMATTHQTTSETIIRMLMENQNQSQNTTRA